MKRIVIAAAAVALFAAMASGVAVAQQVVSPAMVPAPVAPRMTATRPTTTRQYRSYSVNPSRGEVRRNGAHEGDATWRHAGSKAHGHFATGR